VLLSDKVAVIYGGGGAVGGAVAHAFAREGATVHLAGRTKATLDAVADGIRENGGRVATAVSDAGDEQVVEAHVASVVAASERIDVLFNAIGMEDVQGAPLVEMSLDDFMQPVEIATRTQFLTARTVGRQMARRGAGVLLTITAEPTPVGDLGGFGAACAAIEGLWRSLAVELGPYGVRANVIRSPGSPDAPGVRAAIGIHAARTDIPLEGLAREHGRGTPLGRAPLLAEIADVAAMLASDHTSAMTAALVNATCGAYIDT
jgi:NAD(P)-dependent dehydrogenase (short-subunit alcohol dehydrogenase family)